MPKRSSKSEDANQIAHRVVTEATGESVLAPLPLKEKDPLAVALGRRGGLKGGAARAAKLSKERRSEIARQAAASRWKRPKQS